MKISHVSKRRAVTVIAVASAFVLVGAGVAVAATTSKGGTTVTRVSVLTQDTAAVYSSTAWTPIGVQSLYATAGSFIVSTFSAESACYAGTGYCSVRILVDGIETDPVVGTDFAFDSTGGGTENGSSWESHSMQRTRFVGTSTNHTVTVQVASVGTATGRYDDWTLTSMAVTP